MCPEVSVFATAPVRCATDHTTSQTTHTIVTMTKLGGE